MNMRERLGRDSTSSKKKIRKGLAKNFWLPREDSNLNNQSQSLVSYR
jgi:hypothetical protein